MVTSGPRFTPILKEPPSRNTAASNAESVSSAITNFILYPFPGITFPTAVKGTVCPLRYIGESAAFTEGKP